MGIPFTGSFIAENWKDGFRKELTRLVNRRNDSRLYNMYLDNQVLYVGVKSANRIDGFMENRLKEIGENMGEIVRLTNPVGYKKYTVDLELNAPIPTDLSLELLDRAVFARYPQYVESKVHYILFEVYEGGADIIYHSTNINDIKRFVFPLLNPLIKEEDNHKYYIWDLKNKKYHRCYIGVEENKTKPTRAQTNENQIIIPLYKFYFYGKYGY